MSKYLLITVIALCVVVSVTFSMPAYGQQLLMWNRLESQWNVENSDIGPGFQLTSYKFADWEEAQITPAMFGNGLFDNDDIGEGWTNDGGNFFATNVNDMGLSLNQGCIEFWFKFKYASSTHNHTYFLGIRNALTDHFPDVYTITNGYVNMGWNGWHYGSFGKRFFAGIGNSFDSTALNIYTADFSAGPGGHLEFNDGTIFHFACVWDLNGIDGTTDTLRLYVNGNIEAAGTGTWSTTNGFDPYLYLGSAPNYGPSWDHYYNSVKGVTDNIKIWDYAKTDFSDRFEEGVNSPPVADAGPDQTIEQDSLDGAEAQLDGSSSDDPDDDPLTYLWTWGDNESTTGVEPTIELPLGTTTVTLVVNDGTEDSEPDTVDITVEDTTPPELTCPPDITVEQESLDGTEVSLTAIATDICDAEPVIITDELEVYPLGSTTVSFVAIDFSGNISEGQTVVTVEDTTPPDIALDEPDPSVLWPPNHKIVDVTIAGIALDICDADLDIIVSVEVIDSGGGGGSDDYEVLGAAINITDGSVLIQVSLRAERSGRGHGRAYRITAEVTDDTGNSSSDTVEVIVPHNRGRGKGRK